MKKKYQHPQTYVINMETCAPIQTSGGLPAAIEDPTIGGGSGARASKSFWDIEEGETRSNPYGDEEDDYE